MPNHCWIFVVALLSVAASSAAEPAEVDDQVLAEVKKLTLRVTFKQVIGKFSSFNGPSVGDTIELDMNALPQKVLRATSPRAGKPYIPLSAPFQFVKVKSTKPPAGPPQRTLIRLAAEGDGSQCLIRVVADGLQPGDEVRVTLFTNDGFPGSMAEAEGVWK